VGSLYRRPNSKYWWCRYYITGKPYYMSTRCVRKRDAEHFLAIREGEKAKGTPLPPRLDQTRYDELAEDLLRHYKTTGSRRLKEVAPPVP